MERDGAAEHYGSAVPAPLWAFVLLLVIFPGPLPGAAALAVYDFGVLGRLMVGAGGLGRLMAEQLAAFDHAGMLTSVVALIVLSAAVDLVSASARRSLR